tara:strand:+ start:440 stop:898 length:459 start_codon:yes stop_codon:yes gene_type:complete
MIKTIIKAIYSAFISIVLILIVLAGWTSYAFISQPSKSSEIIRVINDMYSSQKSVFINVIELSKILINDSRVGITNENNNLLVETELITDLEDNIQSDELNINEDNGDNPLGIVIEPALPQVSENKLLEMVDESLVNNQNELSMNKMGMELN